MGTVLVTLAVWAFLVALAGLWVWGFVCRWRLYRAIIRRLER